MLPDRWTGDLELLWNALAAALRDPSLEHELLRWLQDRSPWEWARLDDSERSWRAVYKGPSFTSSTLSRGWRSFSGNGHEREAAVRELAFDSHEATNGFLLVRCDDWVGAVRQRARAAILSLVAEGKVDLLTWMPLLLARASPVVAGGARRGAAAWA